MVSTLKFPSHILNETLKQPVLINSYLSNTQQHRVALNEEYSQRLIKSLEKKARSKLATVDEGRAFSGERDAMRMLFKEQTNRLRIPL